MGEDTKTSMQKFEDQNGKVARIIVTIFAVPPILACAVAGVAFGAMLAIPGLAMALVAAIPHWLTRKREDQP